MLTKSWEVRRKVNGTTWTVHAPDRKSARRKWVTLYFGKQPGLVPNPAHYEVTFKGFTKLEPPPRKEK